MEILDRFTNARANSIKELKILKKEGIKIVGTYCSFMPVELILAAGAMPLRLCETQGKYVLQGEKYLPRNLCTIVKSSYGAATSGESPYFEEVDLIIGETTCDGKKKMYEYLNDIKPTHVMQLPQKFESKELSLWKNEINRLKEKLEVEFSVKLTENKIQEAIKTKNKERLMLSHLYELWRAKSSSLKSLDIHNVLFNFEYRLDREKAIDDIQALINIIETKSNAAEISKDCKGKLPRILLTGCPLGEKFHVLINLIDELGGDLVAVETCDWMKGNEELVDEKAPPIDALTKKYLNIPCPVMTPNKKRLDIISKYIDKYKIDGVIDLSLQACLNFNVETIPLKRYLVGEKNVSYMNLQTNLTPTEIGQLSTRIEAFIEMI